MDKRKLEEAFFKVLMLLSTTVVVGSLIAVFTVVVLKGALALSLEMITQTSKGGYYLGKEGGVLNAIIGSLLLAIGATILSTTLSLPIALYLREYAYSSGSARRGKAANGI